MLGSAEKTRKVVILPRGYLSWSAMSCWRSSPARFRREYFEKSSKLDTKYLRFGKGIAKLIEDGEHHSLLPTLPTYDRREYKIRVSVVNDEWEVPIFCILDGDDLVFPCFGEYKTGKVDKKGNAPWSLAKVQKHDQLLYYAVGKRIESGFMPEWCNLHWIETLEEEQQGGSFFGSDRKIAVTGRIETYRRDFDERELDRFEGEIIKVALEISAAYIAYLQEL